MRALVIPLGAAAVGLLLSYGVISRLAGHPVSFEETGAILSKTLEGNPRSGQKLLAEIDLNEPRAAKKNTVSIPAPRNIERTPAAAEISPVISMPLITPAPPANLAIPAVPAASILPDPAVSSSLFLPPAPLFSAAESCDFLLRSQKHLVLINEIAWMGSPVRGGEDESGGAQAEWLEFKNNSGQEISLEGWKLMSKSGKFKIHFEEGAEISEGGYFLLERGSEEAVPEAASDKIYAGVLSNDGEWLRLFDAQCALIDELDASRGWPGGENASKKTLERSAVDLSWNTSANSGGTPRQENSTVYARNTPPLYTASPSPSAPPQSSTTNVLLAAAPDASTSTAASAVARVNINAASYEELQSITGVGAVIAQRIIDYRNQHGFFSVIEEIKNVSGIGDVTFEKMKNEITVGDAATRSSSPPAASSSSPSLESTGKIHINTAGPEELEKITGVGPTIAQRIIDYRNANGPFQKIEDIKNVKGIGDATFEKMKNEITL